MLFLIAVYFKKEPSLSLYLSIQRVPHHYVDANMKLLELESVSMSKTKAPYKDIDTKAARVVRKRVGKRTEMKEGRGGRNGWMFSGA